MDACSRPSPASCAAGCTARGLPPRAALHPHRGPRPPASGPGTCALGSTELRTRDRWRSGTRTSPSRSLLCPSTPQPGRTAGDSTCDVITGEDSAELRSAAKRAAAPSSAPIASTERRRATCVQACRLQAGSKLWVTRPGLQRQRNFLRFLHLILYLPSMSFYFSFGAKCALQPLARAYGKFSSLISCELILCLLYMFFYIALR